MKSAQFLMMRAPFGQIYSAKLTGSAQVNRRWYVMFWLSYCGRVDNGWEIAAGLLYLVRQCFITFFETSKLHRLSYHVNLGRNTIEKSEQGNSCDMWRYCRCPVISNLLSIMLQTYWRVFRAGKTGTQSLEVGQGTMPLLKAR